MVSFWVSAAITSFTIIGGYIGEVLPGVSQNKVDRMIQDIARRKLSLKALLSAPDRGSGDERVHTRPPPRPSKDKSTRTREALEGFLLSFSDQQLVTGFAMLVAMFIKGDITIYSFQVATGVAWFSSTIHLSTLIVLRRYSSEALVEISCLLKLINCY